MRFVRFWLIIAAALLTLPLLALADDYLRVSRNGVVFYYYNNRPSSLATSQAPRTLPEPSTLPPGRSAPRSALIPASQLVPLPPACPTQYDIADAPGDPEPGPTLRPATSLPQLPPLAQIQEGLAAAKQGLLRLLTRLVFFDPPAPPTDAEGSPWPPALSGPPHPFVVPDAWLRAPKYFQEPAPRPGWLASPPAALPLPRYAPQPRLWGKVPASLAFPYAKGPLYYCFPVARPFTFRDSWGDPRSGGRVHRAVDIFAPEGTELYAVTAGVIQRLGTSTSGGIMLFLRGHDGRGYAYMHLMAYAPGIVEGREVKAGDLVGYVGTTGTFNSPAHLHLQVYYDHCFSPDNLVNPYDFLVQLCRGIGVTDLNQPKMARLPELAQLRIVRRPDSLGRNPKAKNPWLQVNPNLWSKAPALKYAPTWTSDLPSPQAGKPLPSQLTKQPAPAFAKPPL